MKVHILLRLLIKEAEFVYNYTKEKLMNGMELESINGKRRSKLIQKSNDQGFQIILIHTNKSDFVLDPFMESGTTDEAALLSVRKFIII